MTSSRISAFLPLLLILWPTIVPTSVAAQDNEPGSGFIYATVTWPSGEAKTGFLRWRDEEAFWDDLFHCGYRDLIWGDYVDLEELRKARRAEYYRSHGLLSRLKYALDTDRKHPMGWRMFLSRFGDLRSIEIHDGEDDFAVTADGARHQIGGYANDAGSVLYLYVAGEERERIRWNDLSEIVFAQAPPNAQPYAERLYGRVEAAPGAFEGFIQWDKSECTTEDVLDGRENDEEVEVPFGEIRTITRARDNSAEVTTIAETTRRLRGGNDVSSDNRGIMIEVAAVGRVTVPWNRFQKVTFSDGHGSGAGRAAFNNAEPLQGEVTAADGRVLAGRLVFDLDEAFYWDVFNGTDSQGLDYDIPFRNVVRIEPKAQNSCRITLRNGLVLELSGNQDTGQENAGVLVFGPGGDGPDHVVWSQVRSVDFKP